MARITVEDCLEVVDNRFELVLMATKRARPALDEIVALAGERPVAVFAHGGIGRVLRGLFLGAPNLEILTMDQPQDAFYRLQRGEAARIHTLDEA